MYVYIYIYIYIYIDIDITASKFEIFHMKISTYTQLP